MAIVYAVVFVAVTFATRAPATRAAGALVGGVAAAGFCLGAGGVGMRLGLWRAWQPTTPSLGGLLLVATALSLAPTYPVTWRAARRFGGRGVVMCVAAAALLGPPRDYLVASMYPQWVTFSRGIGPVMGVALTYAGLVAVGHAAMRLVCGPARADRWARHTSHAPSS